MSATTILVHGRGEQLQDPVSLETAWKESFLRGLSAARVARPPPRERILFPFYGDLYEAYALAMREPSSAEEELDRLSFEREVASQIERKLVRRRNGPLPRRPGDPCKAGFFDPLLEVLDRVPGFSTGFVRLLLRDIHDYLTNRGGLRDRTMRRVFDPIRGSQDGKLIVIAHSLGSVVTYDILNTHAQIKVDLYITMGSPLGIDRAIRSRLLADSEGKRGVPAGVRAWVNLADPDDVVALDETLADDFQKEGAAFVRDIQVRNPRGKNRSPHDSESYLTQQVLGVEVGRVLQALPAAEKGSCSRT